MRLLLCAIALLLAAPAVAAAADTDLGAVDHDTSVATYGETAVWSAFDSASGHFNLMSWTQADGVKAVPVPSREGAFDVDLGPAPDGTLRAVYSREGKLYAFDFATGTERALGISGKRPHVWWDRVTFARKGSLRQRLIGGTLNRTVFKHLPKGFGSFDVGRSVLAYTTNRQRAEGALAQLRARPLARSGSIRVYRASSGAL